MRWFRKTPPPPPGPDLAGRVIDSGCRRIAVLGLHAGAGAATVLAALATRLTERGLVPGVTSAAGGPLEDDPTAWPGERTRLPAGVVAATARAALAEAQAKVTALEDPAGDESVAIVRVEEEGPIVLHGPEDGERMARVLDRLAVAATGPICVTGRWERRSFASPGRVDGWILAVGAAFSPTPERAAAAVRHHVELSRLPVADAGVRLAWEVVRSTNDVVLVGDSGAVLGTAPRGAADTTAAVRAADPARLRAIVFPGALRDESVQPLVRGDWRGDLVVHDATRVHVAPVWYRAWLKDGGAVRVVRPSRLIAIATNPVSPVGEDADAIAFRSLVEAEVAGTPVHDVLLESPESARPHGWRLWSR